jgi:hypothetical protein
MLVSTEPTVSSLSGEQADMIKIATPNMNIDKIRFKKLDDMIIPPCLCEK